jgi:hypothetical protein
MAAEHKLNLPTLTVFSAAAKASTRVCRMSSGAHRIVRQPEHADVDLQLHHDPARERRRSAVTVVIRRSSTARCVLDSTGVESVLYRGRRTAYRFFLGPQLGAGVMQRSGLTEFQVAVELGVFAS